MSAAAVEAVARRAPAVGLVAGVLALAAGGVALGLELERRVVSKRILRADEDEVDQFFRLRTEGISLNTPDGVVLHAEIDDVDGPSTERPDPGLRPRLRAQPRLLALPAGALPRPGPAGPLRPALARPVEPLGRPSCAGSRSWPRICSQVLDELAGDGPLVLVGHSMGGMTIMRLAQTHPELFGDRIRGVALFSTAAGEMADHSPIRGLPGRTFSRVAATADGRRSTGCPNWSSGAARPAATSATW